MKTPEKLPYNRRKGKICEKHPELDGLRHINFRCVGCQLEYMKEYNRRRASDLRKKATMLGKPPPPQSKFAPHHYGKICDKHPELEGARNARSICPGCKTDYQAKWRMTHRTTWLALVKRRNTANKNKAKKIRQQWEDKFGEK